eukprot:CAMPEP_0184495380 /NCGR_PEP_ID=MMETSP0113_2-20130426/31119_1 /TAXON_ID=91329 /ORGANISM="Norrisiella sphaerica, Strain BC52" /LENGTH=549 /DNA_ID=CAMNT_0026881537 /DNA_START=118 /DNA_END=1764 /DNA_ORIENTATION=+
MAVMILYLSAVTGFLMAWAIGAQDVSNALGTCVGSKAITIRQAIVIGGLFEFLGSLMGGDVAHTISKGLVRSSTIEGNVELYMLLMFCTLTGTFCWLAVATYFSLPVSTTHSMVGSILGLGLLVYPVENLNLLTLGTIMGSWITSPLLGFAISYSIFFVIYHRVLTKPQPVKEARRILPFMNAFTVGILTLFLCFAGPRTFRTPLFKGLAICAAICVLVIVTTYLRLNSEVIGLAFPPRTFKNKPHTEPQAFPGLQNPQVHHHQQPGSNCSLRSNSLTSNLATASIPEHQVNISMQTFKKRGEDTKTPAVIHPCSPKVHGLIKTVESQSGVVGQLKGKGETKEQEKLATPPIVSDAMLAGTKISPKKEKNCAIDVVEAPCHERDLRLLEAEAHFTELMILTACVVAFAHGSNDISNAIGPFSVIMEGSLQGDISHNEEIPYWVLVAGGVGIVIGLGTYGHRVMATVGEKITKLTFTRGFAAQIGTALTVLSATMLGLSVSTTHCLIGAIAGVAMVESASKINLNTLKRIALSWVVTMPASAGCSMVSLW